MRFTVVFIENPSNPYSACFCGVCPRFCCLHVPTQPRTLTTLHYKSYCVTFSLSGNVHSSGLDDAREWPVCTCLVDFQVRVEGNQPTIKGEIGFCIGAKWRLSSCMFPDHRYPPCGTCPTTSFLIMQSPVVAVLNSAGGHADIPCPLGTSSLDIDGRQAVNPKFLPTGRKCPKSLI